MRPGEGIDRLHERIKGRSIRNLALRPEINAHVEPGSMVYTDSLRSYNDLNYDYMHNTVPAAVMMVPGTYALETLVYFDRGEILKGLSAGVLVGFVVGSIAFGLAAARFISQPEWLRE